MVRIYKKKKKDKKEKGNVKNYSKRLELVMMLLSFDATTRQMVCADNQNQVLYRRKLTFFLHFGHFLLPLLFSLSIFLHF